MSTRSHLYYTDLQDQTPKNHELYIEIYTDLHEPEGSVVIEVTCSTCNDLKADADYKFIGSRHIKSGISKFLMAYHLGEILVAKLVSSIPYITPKIRQYNRDHDLVIKYYHHSDKNFITIAFSCAGCYCEYSIVMSKHKGEKFLEALGLDQLNRT